MKFNDLKTFLKWEIYDILFRSKKDTTNILTNPYTLIASGVILIFTLNFYLIVFGVFLMVFGFLLRDWKSGKWKHWRNEMLKRSEK